MSQGLYAFVLVVLLVVGITVTAVCVSNCQPEIPTDIRNVPVVLDEISESAEDIHTNVQELLTAVYKAQQLLSGGCECVCPGGGG